MSDEEAPIERSVERMIRIGRALSAVFGQHCPRRLPYDDTIDHWPAFAHGCLLRANYALESTACLRNREVDAAVLTRVLYEHIVAFAWTAIDPTAHLPRLIKSEAEERKKALAGLDQLRASRPGPTAATTYWQQYARGVAQTAPGLPEQAEVADRHWRVHFEEFQTGGLSQLYVLVYRGFSIHVHPVAIGMNAFFSGSAPELEIGRPQPKGQHGVTMAPVIFAMGLLVAGVSLGWPPYDAVHGAFEDANE